MKRISLGLDDVKAQRRARETSLSSREKMHRREVTDDRLDTRNKLGAHSPPRKAAVYEKD